MKSNIHLIYSVLTIFSPHQLLFFTIIIGCIPVNVIESYGCKEKEESGSYRSKSGCGHGQILQSLIGELQVRHEIF